MTYRSHLNGKRRASGSGRRRGRGLIMIKDDRIYRSEPVDKREHEFRARKVESGFFAPRNYDRDEFRDLGVKVLKSEWMEVMHTELERGNSKAVVECCKLTFSYHPMLYGDGTVLILLGRAHVQLQQEKQALQYCDMALKRQPNAWEVYYGVGLIHLSLQNTEIAKRNFKETLKKNPRYLPAMVHLGKLYYQEGYFVRAHRLFNRILNEDADHAVACCYKGCTLIELACYEDAQKFFLRALHANSSLMLAERKLHLVEIILDADSALESFFNLTELQVSADDIKGQQILSYLEFLFRKDLASCRVAIPFKTSKELCELIKKQTYSVVSWLINSMHDQREVCSQGMFAAIISKLGALNKPRWAFAFYKVAIWLNNISVDIHRTALAVAVEMRNIGLAYAVYANAIKDNVDDLELCVAMLSAAGICGDELLAIEIYERYLSKEDESCVRFESQAESSSQLELSEVMRGHGFRARVDAEADRGIEKVSRPGIFKRSAASRSGGVLEVLSELGDEDTAYISM